MKGTKQATSGTLSRSAPARGKFRKVCLVLLLLATAALCGFAPQAYAANWIDYADTGWYDSADEWDGIGYRTYEISTAEELAGLAKLVNEGTENFESQIIRLTADIDLAGKDWTPIGKADTSSAVATWGQPATGISGSNNSGNYFNGMFFGDGHKITGLKIDLNESRVGLFSVLGVDGDRGVGEFLVAVSDLTVEGEVAGASYCGLIAGDSGGATIANCKVKGTVRGSDLHTWEYPDLSNGYPSYAPPQSWSCIGGVAGKGQADNCVAEVTVEGIYMIGGVVGSGIAYGCSASGTVTSLLTENNAFVTDINENVKIRNAQIPPGSFLTWSGREPAYYLADEKLSCAYYDYAGGVAGTGTAVSCRSSVTVKAENLQAVGGVVGGGKALNCAYTGESVTGAHNVGGVVGTGEASNCYAKGTVLATYSKFSSFEPLPEGEQPENHAPIQGDYKEYWVYLGGIVGESSAVNDGTMVNCVSECQLKFTQKGYGIGQIAGYASISQSYYLPSQSLVYDNAGAAFYNIAWTETDYPPFGIVVQKTTQEQAPTTVEYVYAGVSDDGVLDLPQSYVSGFVEKAINDNTYGVKGGAYDVTFYNKHNAFQQNDVSGIVAAVLPENGIAGMNNPKFNFVGYPKNDASGNVSLLVPDEKTAGFAVKAEGAVIELSGIPASYKTASFAYGTVVMASDVNNPSLTIGEDYYAHIGNANDVNYALGGMSYLISPVINAENGNGIGKIGTVSVSKDTYDTYPNGILLAILPGGEEPQPSGVEKVTLDRTEVSLEPAGWVVLKATVWPNGASQTVKWSSSDTNVAVVDANGFVTAKAGAGGTATIRAAAAEDESKYAECVVTVAPMAAPEATIPTIADSVVISDDIDKTAAAEAFTSTEAAAEAISSDIALEQDGNGPVYPTQDAADAAVKASLAEDETLSESAYRLPVFSVSTSSPTAAAAWIVQGPALLADNIEDVDIRKIISGKEAAKFVYKAADFTDGSFTILKTDGTQASGHIDRTAKYQILLFIADNGSFDLNKAKGIIADPAVIVRTSKTEPAPEPEPTPSGGGGGGGCSAGWGALALLAVVPLFARRKK